MVLYHGSDHIVKEPAYGVGRGDNDYGSGFYTTLIPERADEWALIYGADTAYTNIYELDTNGLVILDLDEFGPLAWVAEVISHRGVSSAVANEFAGQMVEKYKINTLEADLVTGYRADDSYTDVIESFMIGEINIDEVKRLFYKGDLGKQYMLKSPRAFDRIRFTDSYIPIGNDGEENSIAIARKQVSNFLQNRRIQLAKRFTVPPITIADAVENTYIYRKDGEYYEKS